MEAFICDEAVTVTMMCARSTPPYMRLPVSFTRVIPIRADIQKENIKLACGK